MLRLAARRFLAAALATAALALPLALVAPPASAAWTAPVLLRQLGGPASPQVYAWGTDYNPVTNELLVGDYVNKTVRRYSASGAYLGNSSGPTNVGLYAGIAVDPRDGSFYVGTQQGGNGVILKFNAAGQHLFTFDPPGLSPFMTVDRSGFLYINNRTGGSKIDKLSVSSNGTYSVVQTFQAPGGTWYNDVAVAADGRVFAVQQSSSRVRVFSPSGALIGQIGAKGNGDGLFQGDMRGITVDSAAGRLYVADSGDNAVEVFTLDGSYVDTWGTKGAGPGQFQDGGRQLTTGPGGRVYVADYGNFRIVPFSPDGDPLTPIPNPIADPDTWGFNSVMDVAVDPLNGDVVGIDSYNQRFQRFSATGELLHVRGRRGSDLPDGMNYPKGIEIDPVTGQVWVIHDELGQPDITVFNRDGSFNRPVVEPQRRWAAAIHNGEVFLLASDYIKVRNVQTGALLRQWSSPGRNLGIDPANGTIYVPARDRVYLFGPNGASLGTMSGGSGNHDATVVGNVVYVTDNVQNRIHAFDKNTRALLGSFGGSGSLPGQIKAPQGIDSDASGKLYVADRGNGRIGVFSTTPVPTDTTAPTVTIETPADDATVAPGPAVVTGTAAGAGSGVAGVEVALRDRTTGLWWNTMAATWGPRQLWNQTAVSGPSAAAQWRFALVGGTSGRTYQVLARARDRAALVTTKAVSRDFAIGDPAPPQTTLTSPADAAVVPAGPLRIEGQAQDDLNLAAVEVSVQDVTAGRWWQPQTQTWVGQATWFDAAVASPGATSSAWSSTVPVQEFGHRYTLSARGVDGTGQVDPSPATATIEVDRTDTLPPDTTVTAVSRPGASDTPLTVTGTGTDNIGVVAVRVAVRNVRSDRWLGADGTFGATKVYLPATLADPGAGTSGWSVTTTLPDGSYEVEALAEDGAGVPDPSPAVQPFLVTAVGADTGPPDAVLNAPADGEPLTIPATLRGTASDDLGVAEVALSVKNQTTNQFWDGTGFVATQVFLPATLDAPGGATTGWSLPTTLPAGRYFTTVRATDVIDRVDPTKPTRAFDVVEATGQLSVERWDGVTGGTLASIPTGAPETGRSQVAAPNGLSYSPGADGYGARLRVLLTAPADGDYTFWVAADEQATLRVGPVAQAPAVTTIARVPAAVSPGQWTRYSVQQSGFVRLEEGESYYLEVAMVEGSGADFAQVAWQRGSTLTPQIIPASAFRPAGSLGATGGWRAQVEVTGGTATQSSIGAGGDAGRARDGNTDGNYGAGSVSHTAGETTALPFWTLDLGRSAPITGVQLWNRTDCCSERLRDAQVFVSANPFTSSDPAVLAATPGVQRVVVNGQLGVITDVTFNGSQARYVRVLLPNPGILSLAEVKVFSG